MACLSRHKEWGVEGPNNGNGLTDDGTASNQGEISTVIFAPANQPELNIGKDADFVQAIFSANDPGGGDAAVLQFNVNTSAPGFLRTSFVFGSDEAPFFLTQEFNDSFAILIDGKNVATIVESGMSKPFTLQDVAQCPQIYLKNDVAPQPSALNGSAHGTPGAPLYNTEFGGFTTRLTRESSIPLAPGTHTIKIVIQDVADRRLDSALFIQENSLKLFPFLVADFDLDGDIDGRDFLTWQRNYLATNATFQQGDANGDGTVDTQDLVIWGNNYGQSGGNKNYCSDFDRDGDADGRDFLIWQRGFGMEHCASRFEGDANGDGAVDSCDLSIWQAEANAAPLAVCACDGGEMAAMAGGGLAERTDDFDPADANQDGKVNASDVALWLDFYREVEK